jgi:hypothetical protein
MKLPQFNAEASLGPATCRYQASIVYGQPGGHEVLPMLAKQCTNCETVGGVRQHQRRRSQILLSTGMGPHSETI